MTNVAALSGDSGILRALRHMTGNMSDASRTTWLRHTVDRCQWIAGRVGHAEPLTVLAEVRALYEGLPTLLGIVEQFLLRGLLGQILSRLLRAHHLDNEPDVARIFLGFASSGMTRGQWERRFIQLLDRATSALVSNIGLGHQQVERALAVLDRRCTDPQLNLEAVAKEIGLSPFHLSRLLKVHTGEGFVAHVHKRRVSAAKTLLSNPQLSIKEIAASVGYRSVSRCGRHFKRLYGSNAASFGIRPRVVKGGRTVRRLRVIGR
jgi:AraC-like DNA-binding protein